MNHLLPSNLTNISGGYVNNNSTEDPFYAYMLLSAGMGSLGAVTLVINVAVLACLVRHHDQLGTEAVRAELMSITLSDFMTSIALISTCLSNLSAFRYNRYACAVLVLLYHVVQAATIFTLALIGGKRLVKVLNVEKKQSGSPDNGARFIQISVPVIWTLSVLLYVGLYFVFAEKGSIIPMCRPKEVFGENIKMFINCIAYLSISSLLIVNGIYLTILIKLKSLYPSPAGRKRPCCISCSNTTVDGDDNVDADQPDNYPSQNTSVQTLGDFGRHRTRTISLSVTEKSLSLDLTSANSRRSAGSKQAVFEAISRNRQKHNVKALMTVTLVLVAVNVSTAPFVILRVVRNLASVEVHPVIGISVNACISLNALLDPFVYCWRVKQVRQAMKKTLLSIFCLDVSHT